MCSRIDCRLIGNHDEMLVIAARKQ